MTRQPAILRTTLGSCVAVAFWCARLRAGALCHGVLPRCPANLPADDPLEDACRYVDFSIRHLARQFDALGAVRMELQVKVFGGADVLPVTADQRKKPTIGAQNCISAADTLAEEGFSITAYDLGGDRGRRIHFHTGTGEVRLYRLGPWGKSGLR